MEWSQADRFILAMISQNFDIEVIIDYTFEPIQYMINAFTEADTHLCTVYFDKQGNHIEKDYISI